MKASKPPRNKGQKANKIVRAQAPITRLTDPRLDFPDRASLRNAYIVASTDRSGSTYLCSLLWQTGVLGAPAEYWNFRSRPNAKPIGVQMIERLGGSSPADYLTKLLARRTSRNGVFGVKAHSFDFEEVVRQYPEILERLSPLTYIYIERKDKVAQAVSMAKAAQTGAWVSYAKLQRAGNLHYDKDLIAKCLGFLERQNQDWQRWFEANRIEPFVVTYENLAEDAEGVVRGIVELLGAENDEPQKVQNPKLEKQGDETNEEWAARFRRKRNADEPTPSKGSHVFDAYEDLRDTAARPIAGIRLRHRYDAIIGNNRALFKSANVLDIHCRDGRWTLAALDAGAAHVVAVENEDQSIETARHNLERLGTKSSTYELINSDIGPALRSFSPEAFDLVLCTEFSQLPDPHLFFNRLRRLRPRHVIIDSEMTGGKVPMVSFKLHKQEQSGPKAGRGSAIYAIPNHELIRVLCNYFGFKWRAVDWHDLGITNWTGVHDYEDGRRRTYVLEAND